MSFSLLLPRPTIFEIPTYWEHSSHHRTPISRATSHPDISKAWLSSQRESNLEEPKIELSTDDTGDKRIIRARCPGFSKENISVESEDRLLTISGFVERNGRHWRVTRSVLLPEGVGQKDITAKFIKGVLEISFPKTNRNMRIPIRHENDHWMIAYPPVVRKRPPRRVQKKKSKLTQQQLLAKREKEASNTAPGYLVRWVKNLPFLFREKVFKQPNLERIWQEQIKYFPGYTLDLMEGISLLFEKSVPTMMTQEPQKSIETQGVTQHITHPSVPYPSVTHPFDEMKLPIYLNKEVIKHQHMKDQQERAILTPTGFNAK